MNLGPLRWEHGVLATRPPGKFHNWYNSMAPSHKLPESHTFTAWRAGRFPPALQVSTHLTPKRCVSYSNCRQNNTSFQTFCILSLLTILSMGPRKQGRKLQPPLIDAEGWGGCLADLFTISGMDESEAGLHSKPMAYFSASSCLIW